MRESFVFYRSFYEAIALQPRDIQVEIYTAIMEYALNGKEIGSLKPIGRSVFAVIKPIIDKNNKRRENGKKGAEFGKLGGAPKGNKNAAKDNKNNPKTTPKQPQNNPKTTPNNILVVDKSPTNNILITTSSTTTSTSSAQARENDGVLNDSKETRLFAALKANNEIWQDSICKKFHLSKQVLLERIDNFALDCQCRETSHESMQDLKRHFCDWLRIQIKHENENKKPPTDNRRRTRATVYPAKPSEPSCGLITDNDEPAVTF